MFLQTSVFPYLLSALASARVDDSLVQEVKNLLVHLESQLAGKKTLTGVCYKPIM